MAKPSEKISKATSNSVAKPDVNTSNDSNNLGGIPADQYLIREDAQQIINNKEVDLKDYVDNQDANMLQQAKNYTDTVIQNQDFSNFAEINDLQVLNQNLNNKITECGTNCENKINNKIGEVVRDVNENFNDVNSSINTLNGNMNQLFTSVSSGKSQIAEAITDKGVSTSANDSFSTMANKIEQIQTSGGGGDTPEYDENFVNTGDATAIAEDISVGKTAYVKGAKLWGTHKDLNTNDATAKPEDIMDGKSAYINGIKVYGTYEPLDTSDATAQPQHILKGRTAYVNENKIIGTYEPEGLDTSDATATPNDIKLGETAYVDGEKITGTYEPLDTSDANATASDILLGKTAYVDGEKIIGTNTNSEGIDTSDATAYSSDLRNGTTAYVRGQKITGTLIPESGGGGEYIGKIYGTDSSTLQTFFVSGITGSSCFIYDESREKPMYCIQRNNDCFETYQVSGNLLLNKNSFTFQELGLVDENGNTPTIIRDLCATDIQQSNPYVVVNAGSKGYDVSIINILPYYIENENLYLQPVSVYDQSHQTPGCHNKRLAISPNGNIIVNVAVGIGETSSTSLYGTTYIEIYSISYNLKQISYIDSVQIRGMSIVVQFINNKLIYLSKSYSPEGIIIVLDKYGFVKKSTTISKCLGISHDGEYMLTENNTNGFKINKIKINVNYDTGDITQSTTTVIDNVEIVNKEGFEKTEGGLLFSDSNILFFQYRSPATHCATAIIDFENDTFTSIDDATYSDTQTISPKTIILTDETKLSQNGKFIYKWKKYMIIKSDYDVITAIIYGGETYYKRGY